MKRRYEIKYFIRPAEYETLRRRAAALLLPDAHSGPQGYTVSSLYFDDILLGAYRQKVDGVDDRWKYRIRVYNDCASLILLEKKSRRHGFIQKHTVALSMEEYRAILAGGRRVPRGAPGPLAADFQARVALLRLAPTVIVRYNRVAFTDRLGTRVTFDSHIQAGCGEKDLFSSRPGYLLALNSPLVVLEIKFTDRLPAVVRTLFGGLNIQPESISKYELCMNKRFEVRHHVRDC